MLTDTDQLQLQPVSRHPKGTTGNALVVCLSKLVHHLELNQTRSRTKHSCFSQQGNLTGQSHLTELSQFKFYRSGLFKIADPEYTCLNKKVLLHEAARGILPTA